MAMNYSKLLRHDDYEYLSALYDIEVDLIVTFTDDDWCDFLNCDRSELAYALLGDETYVEPTDDELKDLDAEADFYLANSMDSLFGDEEAEEDFASFFGEVVVLEKERNQRRKPQPTLASSVSRHPAKTSGVVRSTPKVGRNYGNSWTWSQTPPKVKHYFKLVH